MRERAVPEQRERADPQQDGERYSCILFFTVPKYLCFNIL